MCEITNFTIINIKLQIQMGPGRRTATVNRGQEEVLVLEMAPGSSRASR